MKDNLLDGEYLINTEWLVKTGGYAKDMTLRDHFAKLAMEGILYAGLEPVETATHAYTMADAMLKERAK